MPLLRKITIINTGTIVGILIGTAQTIILSRVLGPKGVGQYSLSIAVLSLTATIFAFGCPLSYLFYAKQAPQERNKYFAGAFWLLLGIGVTAGGLLAVYYAFQEDFLGKYSVYVIACIVPYIPFVLLRLLFRNHLLVRIEAKQLTLVELMATGGTLLFVACMWVLDFLTVNTALLSFILAAGIRAATGWLYIRADVTMPGAPSRKYMSDLGRMGVRQMWPDLITILNDQLGIVLLKLLIDDFNEIGMFSRGLSLASLMILLSQVLMPVLFSSWAGLPAEALRDHVEKVLRFISSFSLAVAFSMIVFGNWIVLLLYGKAFLPSVVPMRILALGAAFAIISRTFIQLFSGRGIPEKGTRALAAGTVVTVLLCWLMIPAWGIIGCALAITSGQLMIMLMMFAYGKFHFNLVLKQCAFINRNDFNLTLKSLIKARSGV